VYLRPVYSYGQFTTLTTTHANGSAVTPVTLTSKTLATDYTLDGVADTVTLVAGQFAAGNAVITNYYTDYIVPATYPRPLNDDIADPVLDETWGEWKGLALADGTYTVGIWSRLRNTVALYGETDTDIVLSAIQGLAKNHSEQARERIEHLALFAIDPAIRSQAEGCLNYSSSAKVSVDNMQD